MYTQKHETHIIHVCEKKMISLTARKTGSNIMIAQVLVNQRISFVLSKKQNHLL